ncbi:phosphatase PAP2 family protein [uncultured Kordia sp.]|uniref:phosphatase PAP2 family protein n=1 Tax=uncultured Kordia sp. TaxID=507699 RepID=UPI00261982BD|nr:phosphatase PAP2 family protein [uncultured Kordia sp.]
MNKIAKVISIVGHPLLFLPILIGLTLISLEGIRTSIQSLGILAGLSIIPTTIWVFIKTKNGSYTNFDVSNQRQRRTLFPFIIILLTLTTFVLYITNMPEYLCLGLLICTGLILISFFVNFKIKSSLHVSMTAYAALCISFISISLSIGLFLFTISIAWSRVVLKRHSVLEVCTGLLLGSIAGFIFINMYQAENPQGKLSNSAITSCTFIETISTSAPVFKVFPKESFIDEPVNISVSRLASF